MHGDYVELPFAVHPGETLSEKLEEMGMSVSELSRRTGFSEKELSGVMSCKKSISPALAEALASVTKIPVYFWIDSQQDYDTFMARKRTERLMRKLQRSSVSSTVVSPVLPLQTPQSVRVVCR